MYIYDLHSGSVVSSETGTDGGSDRGGSGVCNAVPAHGRGSADKAGRCPRPRKAEHDGLSASGPPNRDAGSGHDAADGCDDGTIQEPAERIIPLEIDDHFRLYGKEPWEVSYGERCLECNSRIDEYGFCSCGAHGD